MLTRRIVVVGSTAHTLAKIDLEDLHMEHSKNLGLFNGIPYANSKLALALFVRELTLRLQGTGVTAYILCPGFVSTSLFRQTTTMQRILMAVTSPFSRLTENQV